MESFIIYLLKASALLGIFYLSYFFLLKKETTFQLNRKYLLLGIITAGILPAIYFTKKVYVEASSQSYSFITNSPGVSSVSAETPIDWWQIAGMVYLILTGFFLLRFSLQLISVFRILYSCKTQNISGLKYLKTENDNLPFSFFNYIVYNPKIHSEKDLELILEHEKIHARQLHSADILLVNLVSCILWFNPFAWLYKKSVEQNLEFIADRETVTTNTEIKEYQRALLKVSIADLRPALTNHFYQSFIKKRILMLNKKSSTQSPAWKLSVLLPVLLTFMLLFNVNTEAQVIPPEGNREEPKVNRSAEKIIAIQNSTTIEKAYNPTANYGNSIKSSGFPKSDEGFIWIEIKSNSKILKSKPDTGYTKPSNAKSIENDTTKTKIHQQKVQPLYIVNEEVKSKDFDINSIAPSSISSVNVLKGESATDEYGQKAKNGVIQIFTNSYQGDKEKKSDPRFFAIAANATNSELEKTGTKIEDKLGIEVNFSEVKRNKNGQITKISISAKKDGQNVSFNLSDTEGLQTIIMGLSKDGRITISHKTSKDQF